MIHSSSATVNVSRWRARLPRVLLAIVASLALVAVDTAPAMASSPAFVQVPGSPFSTGSNSYPASVVFNPSSRLLAIANYGTTTVSVFSVGAGGVLSQVSGSPFAAGVACPGPGPFPPFRPSRPHLPFHPHQKAAAISAYRATRATPSSQEYSPS